MRLGWMISVVGCVHARAPSAPPDAPFRFAVIGDRTDEPNDAAWQQTLAEIEASRPELVVTVGDLADDALDPADWDTAIAATRVLSMPIAYTPGNHDIQDEATALVFAEQTGQAPYRSFDQGGVHFVIVDNSIAESWETLPDAQRSWLASDLAAHAGEPIAVFMHKPFWALGVAAGKPDAMHALFVQSGVRAVFTGHWHNHAHQRIDGIDYTIVGTSGGAFPGLPNVHTGNTYEFATVTVTDGSFTIERVTDDRVLPVDSVSLADSSRVRAIRQGGVRAALRTGDDGQTVLALHVENLGASPMDDLLTLDPGAWTVATATVPLRILPGESFDTTIPVSMSGATYPLPRVTLNLSLPDAGPIPYTAVVDHRRELTVKSGKVPSVDGVLGDGEWEGVVPHTAFTNREGVTASGDPLTVWMRYTDDALYLAARCDDADPSALKRLHTGRDGNVSYDDRIGLLLAPSPEQLYWFYVNPNGAVWDLHVDRVAKKVDREWNAVEAAATVDASGWVAEARMPFAALGLAGPPASIGFDLRRRQHRTQTEALFTPAFGFADPNRLGLLTLVP